MFHHQEEKVKRTHNEVPVFIYYFSNLLLFDLVLILYIIIVSDSCGDDHTFMFFLISEKHNLNTHK